MHTRRLIGVVLLVLAIAGAFAEASMVRREEQRARRRLQERAEKTALAARAGAKDWISGKLKMLEGQAGSAASITPIKSQVVTFDAATLRDGFHSEQWWEPYRRDFSVSAMAYAGDQVDALEGLEPGELDVTELVQKARANRVASMFLRAGPKKWPYAAVGAVVDVPRPVPAVLLLARPFDLAFGQELAEKLGGAVLLTDGQQILVGAGPQEAQIELKSALGKESQPFFAPPDTSWVATPTVVLPGLILWSHASIGAEAAEYRADVESAQGTLFTVQIVAGVFGLIGLFLLVRGAPQPAAAPTGQTGVSASALDGAMQQPPAPAPVPRSVGRTGITPADTRLSPSSGRSDPQALLAEAEGATALTLAAPQAQPENVFGRYFLLDRLGEGGMAEVFTAVAYGAENFRRTFVVKRLRAEMLRNPSVISSFIDEANLASTLVHSNIVPVFDFGRVGDEYYMATEYILGRDLGKVNRRSLDQEQKTLPLGQVFFVAHQTLEALDYAHNKTNDQGQPLGVVHRDVSPNNILISARGEVKLFDFGIAKAEGRLTQTQYGMVKGNVRFMSPEQARGEPVDARSDLFAIGLVIYYALSGDSLYEADTAYNLLVKAAMGPGAPELEALHRLPKEAHRILERALQPNPADRFQSATEFATALQPFIAGQQALLARTMDKLFGADIQAELARFASASAAQGQAQGVTGTSGPHGNAAAAPAPSGSTQHFSSPPPTGQA
jgi:hypothetical protein